MNTNIIIDDKDIKAIQKGYYCQLKRFEQEGDTLYIRPNKRYEIGNNINYSIQVGEGHVGSIICDKDCNVIIEKDIMTNEIIEVNGIEKQNRSLEYLKTNSIF